MERQIHKIDATNQVLGRLATQIAVILRGKHKPTFRPYLDEGDSVIVENIDKIKITGKKFSDKIYHSYSGYPGGLKSKKMNEFGLDELLKKAVYNMLPENKLRKNMIKRLMIK